MKQVSPPGSLERRPSPAGRGAADLLTAALVSSVIERAGLSAPPKVAAPLGQGCPGQLPWCSAFSGLLGARGIPLPWEGLLV